MCPIQTHSRSPNPKSSNPKLAHPYFDCVNKWIYTGSQWNSGRCATHVPLPTAVQVIDWKLGKKYKLLNYD